MKQVELEKPIAQLTLNDYAAFVGDIRKELAEQARRMFDGDHWLEGDGWTGAKPDKKQARDFSTTMDDIQSHFTSSNKIAEVVIRQRSAVVGRMPNWSFVPRRKLGVKEVPDPNRTDSTTVLETESPTKEEQTALDEANEVMTEWWDKRQILDLLQNAIDALLVEGRCVARIYLAPPEAGQTKQKYNSLLDALDALYIDILDNDKAAVIQDLVTRQEIGVNLYQISNKRYAEVTYKNRQNKKTVHALISESGTESLEYELGGNLLMFELEHPALVTEQVISQNKKINCASTMALRNVVIAGARERIMVNVALEGTDETDESTGMPRFMPEMFQVGAGTVHNLVGIETESPDGKRTLANPDFKVFDPVQPDCFTKTKLMAYEAILEEVDQLHALIAGDATPSGESRIQALNQFKQRSTKVKTQADALLRWILDSAYAFAAYLSGTKAANLIKVNAECRLHFGFPTSEEITSAISLKDARVWSRQRLQTYTGVDDTDSEDAQIQMENPSDGLELERSKLQVAQEKAFLKDMSGAMGQTGNSDTGTGASGDTGTGSNLVQ